MNNTPKRLWKAGYPLLKWLLALILLQEITLAAVFYFWMKVDGWSSDMFSFLFETLGIDALTASMNAQQFPWLTINGETGYDFPVFVFSFVLLLLSGTGLCIFLSRYPKEPAAAKMHWRRFFIAWLLLSLLDIARWIK